MLEMIVNGLFNPVSVEWMHQVNELVDVARHFVFFEPHHFAGSVRPYNIIVSEIPNPVSIDRVVEGRLKCMVANPQLVIFVDLSKEMRGGGPLSTNHRVKALI